MRPRGSQTLTELERQDWGEPDFDSHLVQTVHRLRHKPIGEFTPGELRICIGQSVGLLFLIPLALDVLENEPLVDADYYPGDLLAYVLSADVTFWMRQTHLRERLLAIVDSVSESTDNESVLAAITRFPAA